MEKYIRVKMPHGLFEIPASVVAEDRAKYYAKLDSERGEGLYGDIFKSEIKYVMEEHDGSEIIDWASNNMNWKDVESYSVRIELPQKKVDFEKAWTNADKQVISK